VLERVRALLACPLCRGPLDEARGTLRCASGHAFDVARQGYVNLAAAVGHAPVNADDAGSVAARAEFLSGGHFGPVAREVADRVAAVAPAEAAVLDAGAGIGYYLAAVLDAVPGAVGLAVDSSPAALRRAARAHPRAGAFGWDLRLPLPVRDGSVHVVLNVFAPRNAAEYARVLAPGGALLVVTPGAGHLAELVDALGQIGVDTEKPARLAATLDPLFTLRECSGLDLGLRLPRAAAAAMVRMSPSAHHLRAGGLAAGLAALPDPVAVTASVRVATYARREPARPLFTPEG
jgi:23S rRNA (guanine745-N1)-methyltransferase